MGNIPSKNETISDLQLEQTRRRYSLASERHDHWVQIALIELQERRAKEPAPEIERATRIMRRAVSWLQIKEAAFATAKGPAIIEEMQRFIAGSPDETKVPFSKAHAKRILQDWIEDEAHAESLHHWPDLRAAYDALRAVADSPVETSREPQVGDEVTLHFTSSLVKSREGWKIDRIAREEYFFLSDGHGSQISLLRGQFSLNGK